jgi:hypothetical protein
MTTRVTDAALRALLASITTRFNLVVDARRAEAQALKRLHALAEGRRLSTNQHVVLSQISRFDDDRKARRELGQLSRDPRTFLGRSLSTMAVRDRPVIC